MKFSTLELYFCNFHVRHRYPTLLRLDIFLLMFQFFSLLYFHDIKYLAAAFAVDSSQSIPLAYCDADAMN